jgi:hypothetical protein
MRNEKSGLLNSWKEVASYLGRGVRTVQRWEKIGLPVRRVGNGSRAPVIANSSDIDRWMQQARGGGLVAPAMAEQIFCKGDLRESIEQSRMLREKLALLRSTQRSTVAELMSTISKLEKCCVSPPVGMSVVPEQEIDLRHRPQESAREALRMTA